MKQEKVGLFVQVHKIKKKIEYEPSDFKYRCSANCLAGEKSTEDNYCVDDCALLTDNKKFYYPNENNKNILKCISNCNVVGKKEQNNECVSQCDVGYYLENNEKCVSQCPSGYYTGNNICLDTVPSDCLYSQEQQNSNNKRCYASCADIGNGYIYKRGAICSNVECSNFYSEENGMKICYDTTTDCYNDGYHYYQSNKCLKECLGYEDGDNTGTDSIYCFPTIFDCIARNYRYYELSSRKCYSNSCPTNYYPKYPSENNGYQCIDCSNLKISNGFCKDNCENDECFFIDENNNGHIPINQCNSISNHFYYINGSNKRICVDN